MKTRKFEWHGVAVEFEYTKGSPGTGPSYSSGGDPPDPAEFKVTSVFIVDDDEFLSFYGDDIDEALRDLDIEGMDEA